MHKKIKFFKNELLNMIKLTQFIKKFNGSFGPPYPTLPSFWHPTLNFFLNRFTRFRRKSSDSAKEKIGKTI